MPQGTTGRNARRWELISLALVCGAAPAARAAPSMPASPPEVTYLLTPALGSLTFSQPVCLASPPGDARSLFVCEKTGLLKRVPDVTAATPSAAVYLNLPAVLAARGEAIQTGGEQGLLGLAFHPDYALNRQFYVFYSVRKADNLVYQRVSRFLAQSSNPAIADTASESILLEQRDEATNHNGGGLAFGPDGYLYISLGDEGGSNDQFNNSQRIDKDFFSGLLRIDVDKLPGSLDPNSHPSVPRDAGVARYAVPPDNPFVGATSFNGAAVNPALVRTEFWAVGLRNPWRFSFDPATNELWLADVGQNAREEIDIIARGGNYGWAYREGNIAGPKTPPAGFASIAPIYDYARGTGEFQGNAVTGGVVYRGLRFGGLLGAYVFADYVSGNVWTLRRVEGASPEIVRIADETGLVAFGQDPSNGDILAADLNDNRILRLVSTTVTGSFPQTLSATGLFENTASLEPVASVLEYSLNLPAWADFASTRRWFFTPSGAPMTWMRDEPWAFPDGMVWVRHLEIELTRDDPASRRRIETRVLVKNPAGAYGVSYRWNEAQTEAALAPDEGAAIPLTVVENGVPHTQTWTIPSRAQCMVCHTQAAGFALSFDTRQLNRVGGIGSADENQLSRLHALGLLSNPPDSPNLLPHHPLPADAELPLETRARAWLAVNCASCHQPGGDAPATLDARAHLTLAQTGLLDGSPANDFGDPANRLLAPGDVAHSLIHQRIATVNPSHIPALNEVDDAGLNLLRDWIVELGAAERTYAQWRAARFDSATSPEGAPEADPDGDRRANEAEFLAGTSPLAPDSFAGELTSDGGGVTLAFIAPPNRIYQIEVSEDLASWTPLDVPGAFGPVPANGRVNLSVTIPLTRMFYRLVLREQ